LAEYRNYRTVLPKELGKDVSAVTDTKLVADRYSCGNESIITFQGVTISDSLGSTCRHLGQSPEPREQRRALPEQYN
jgi:hypothetical protein